MLYPQQTQTQIFPSLINLISILFKKKKKKRVEKREGKRRRERKIANKQINKQKCLTPASVRKILRSSSLHR